MTRAFIYDPKCNNIIRKGPYRWIRHPIYLSYSLAWSAAPVATHNPVLALSAVVMIVCYVLSAREEERRMTLGLLKDEYTEWQKQTWRLIPFVY
jgi:protein-S-isoprenylcysteine O-methyltransferase Ste14